MNLTQLVVYREQLAGERKAELERLEREAEEAAASQAAEMEKLRQEEIRYRMELEVGIQDSSRVYNIILFGKISYSALCISKKPLLLSKAQHVSR